MCAHIYEIIHIFFRQFLFLIKLFYLSGIIPFFITSNKMRSKSFWNAHYFSNKIMFIFDCKNFRLDFQVLKFQGQKELSRGWGPGLAIKSSYCSYRGPELAPWKLARDSSFRVFVTLLYLSDTHNQMTCTHMHINKNENKSLKN